MSMINAAEVPMPESNKLLAVAPYSQRIGDFLDWLEGDGWCIAKPHDHKASGCDEDNQGFWACGLSKDELEHDRRSRETILAQFFEINMNKVEQERRALLEAIRK